MAQAQFLAKTEILPPQPDSYPWDRRIPVLPIRKLRNSGRDSELFADLRLGSTERSSIKYC